MVHEMLYQSDSLSRINHHDYLKNLVEKLITSFKGTENNIELKLIANDVALNIDTAIPLGLLINETTVGLNKIYHWKHRYPIATYLISVAITNYVEYTDVATLTPRFVTGQSPTPNAFSEEITLVASLLIKS